MAHNIKKGVILGKEVQEVFKYAKEKGFALPAANVISSNSINAALETAVAVNAAIRELDNHWGVYCYSGF